MALFHKTNSEDIFTGGNSGTGRKIKKSKMVNAK
jgi:hypothetical protein